MQFLRRLFSRAVPPADPALMLYARCERCGAAVRVRVHLYNDLSVEYDEGEGVAGYRLRKEIMDSRCFRVMAADLHFDKARRITSRTLSGGSFITAEEYAAIADA